MTDGELLNLLWMALRRNCFSFALEPDRGSAETRVVLILFLLLILGKGTKMENSRLRDNGLNLKRHQVVTRVISTVSDFSTYFL